MDRAQASGAAFRRDHAWAITGTMIQVEKDAPHKSGDVQVRVLLVSLRWDLVKNPVDWNGPAAVDTP